MEASDDPLRNGLDVTEKSPVRPDARAADETQTDWMFSGKTKPSPYQ
jgi:hypothetical protein